MCQAARVIGEILPDIRLHMVGDVIHIHRWHGRRCTRPLLAKRLSIFSIKIPSAAFGLVTLHQNTVLLAHIAVKELHAQRFQRPSPLLERIPTAHEMRIFEHF